MEPSICEVKWSEVHASFERKHDTLLEKYPGAAQEVGNIRAALIKIRQLVKESPQENGSGPAWKKLADRAEADRSSLCRHLNGKAVFTGLVHLYKTTHRDMVESMKAAHSDMQEIDAHEGLKEQRRRMRGSSDDQGKQTKRVAMPTAGAMDQLEIPTRNFFAPLRTADKEVEHTEDNSDRTDGDHQQQSPSSRRGRPLPIILTSAINLIQLQKQLKSFVKSSFEFRKTRNGTRVVTKEMADFSTIKEHFNSQNLNYFTDLPKFLKPMNAVIQHLPRNTPAEEIYKGLVELGFDIISVKQMSTTRRSQGSESINLPLFRITLPRLEKFHENFKLTSFCYISTKV
jgi:hypothetical protein